MTDVMNRARRALTIEMEALDRVGRRLNSGFELAVELIQAARLNKGKLITTGIGKSGLVARKIMATLNSTGTPAIFLHPVEALHGDLGMVYPGDVVLALSNSGETEELVNLLPQLRGHGAKIVAMTGGMESSLAQGADAVIDTGVEREACPYNLAPTASTTACMAVGDALAVVLMELADFRPEDFRRHHPGGKLGERLAMAVIDVMLPQAAMPTVGPKATMDEAVRVMDRGDLGSVFITDNGLPGGTLQGLFTDGDLRRAIVAGRGLQGRGVADFMTRSPLTIGPGLTAAEALHLMEQRLITVLPIVQEGRLLGIVHLHDLLGRGTVSFKPTACADE